MKLIKFNDIGNGLGSASVLSDEEIFTTPDRTSKVTYGVPNDASQLALPQIFNFVGEPGNVFSHYMQLPADQTNGAIDNALFNQVLSEETVAPEWDGDPVADPFAWAQANEFYIVKQPGDA